MLVARINVNCLNTSMKEDNSLTKIVVRTIRDESGYPPVEYEDIWARQIAEGQYEVDNVPFFARGLRIGDVVSVTRSDDFQLLISNVLRASDHSTLRVIVFRDSPDKRLLEERVLDLRLSLASKGCSTELSYIPGLIAVDVPPQVSLDTITTMLSDGESSGFWEYEEAALS